MGWGCKACLRAGPVITPIRAEDSNVTFAEKI